MSVGSFMDYWIMANTLDLQSETTLRARIIRLVLSFDFHSDAVSLRRTVTEVSSNLDLIAVFAGMDMPRLTNALTRP